MATPTSIATIGLTFLITLTPYRLLPDLFLLICVVLWFRNRQIRRDRILIMFLAPFLLTKAFLPFDVSLLYWPGRPRVVRLVRSPP